MTRRYAEDTEVPVSRFQAEVRDMLRSMGAGRIAIMDEPGQPGALMFEQGGRAYRLTVPVSQEIAAKTRAQDERRAWRLLVLLVKAKFQAVKEGLSSVEREFFADTVMPSGRLLVDEARESIAAAMADRGPLRLEWKP